MPRKLTVVAEYMTEAVVYGGLTMTRYEMIAHLTETAKATGRADWQSLVNIYLAGHARQNLREPVDRSHPQTFPPPRPPHRPVCDHPCEICERYTLAQLLVAAGSQRRPVSIAQALAKRNVPEWIKAQYRGTNTSGVT